VKESADAPSGLEDRLDVGSRGRGVAAGDEEEVGSDVLHLCGGMDEGGEGKRGGGGEVSGRVAARGGEGFCWCGELERASCSCCGAKVKVPIPCLAAPARPPGAPCSSSSREGENSAGRGARSEPGRGGGRGAVGARKGGREGRGRRAGCTVSWIDPLAEWAARLESERGGSSCEPGRAEGRASSRRWPPRPGRTSLPLLTSVTL